MQWQMHELAKKTNPGLAFSLLTKLPQVGFSPEIISVDHQLMKRNPISNLAMQGQLHTVHAWDHVNKDKHELLRPDGPITQSILSVHIMKTSPPNIIQHIVLDKHTLGTCPFNVVLAMRAKNKLMNNNIRWTTTELAALFKCSTNNNCRTK